MTATSKTHGWKRFASPFTPLCCVQACVRLKIKKQKATSVMPVFLLTTLGGPSNLVRRMGKRARKRKRRIRRSIKSWRKSAAGKRRTRMIEKRASTGKCKRRARSCSQGQNLARSISHQKASITKHSISKAEAKSNDCRKNRIIPGGKFKMRWTLMRGKNKKCRPWRNTLTAQINSRKDSHRYAQS